MVKYLIRFQLLLTHLVGPNVTLAKGESIPYWFMVFWSINLINCFISETFFSDSTAH